MWAPGTSRQAKGNRVGCVIWGWRARGVSSDGFHAKTCLMGQNHQKGWRRNGFHLSGAMPCWWRRGGGATIAQRQPSLGHVDGVSSKRCGDGVDPLSGGFFFHSSLLAGVALHQNDNTAAPVMNGIVLRVLTAHLHIIQSRMGHCCMATCSRTWFQLKP